MIKSWARKGMTVFAAAYLLSACTAIHPPSPNLPARADVLPGETITVKGSQNVYAVAREYNASMREIIVLNNLQPPFALKSGQSLVLPAKAGEAIKGIGTSPVSAAPTGAIEKVELAPVETAPLKSVAAAPIEALNAPSAPPKPVATTVAPAAAAAVAVATPVAVAPVVKPPEPLAAAPVSPTQPAATNITMSWPVQGPIVSAYGPKGQGLNNDGVNIGAPKGASVVAAAGGIVVYAGNEMKGFGNLILIRHEGGWVTAYAHLDRMLVAKDAVVAQGDMIGTVGKTGNVPSPQLHFETRYQGKAVDPAGVIK